MTLNNDMAALVGFGCEAFFYGLFSVPSRALARQVDCAHSPLGCYTILFALAIYLKFNGPNRTSSVKGPLFILSVILYLSCSTHFAMVFIYSYKVLVCAMPYSSYAISEHHCRIPQAWSDSQTIQPFLTPRSSM
jgi:hypothetical protein